MYIYIYIYIYIHMYISLINMSYKMKKMSSVVKRLLVSLTYIPKCMTTTHAITGNLMVLMSFLLTIMR